jgi:hypothetical protein
VCIPWVSGFSMDFRMRQRNLRPQLHLRVRQWLRGGMQQGGRGVQVCTWLAGRQV